MDATVSTLYGNISGAERATPGSYGEKPQGYRLPDGTRIGSVRLQVADLERSVRFYQDVMGFRIIQRSATQAALAAHGDDRVLVELVEHAGARPSRRGLLGLYHFAILLPDRPSLGRFVRHLGQLGVRAGAGDHLVSEAFYLSDPDGLGIEVYADRPRDTWHRRGRELLMATDPVDVDDLLRAAGGTAWSGMPAGTTIGHVHLHVGEIEPAKEFFVDGIGFDRMTWSYPGALFLAAGGYHHHLGTNTWAGPSANAPAVDDAQLLEWVLELPDSSSVAEVRENLANHGVTVHSDADGSFLVRDPWGTAVRVRGG